MGLTSWLLDLGIRVEETVQHVGVRVGAVPLQWPAGESGSLIYRLPRDPHQRASLLSSTQSIVVNEGEVAVVLRDGKAQGALEPGRYRLERDRVVGLLDAIWIKTGQRALKWGLGNVTSSDGIQLGANGILYVRVTDALLFNAEVVQGEVRLAEVDLQRFLMPRIQGVLRSVFAGWAAMELQTQRAVFAEAIATALSEVFAGLGLGIAGLEVVEISFPAEFKAAIAQATLSQHTGRAALVDAQTRAQALQIEAAAAAQAGLTAGLAQVQLMAQMQAQGIDPLKLKALEALQTFAATPSTGGGLLGGNDAARSQFFGQLAAAALSPGSPEPVRPLTAELVRDSAAPPAPDGAEEPRPETAADLERQIDALGLRLAEGKIGEDTYNKLVGRLEAKLARLREPSEQATEESA